jgi:hypothetical protein
MVVLPDATLWIRRSALDELQVETPHEFASRDEGAADLALGPDRPRQDRTRLLDSVHDDHELDDAVPDSPSARGSPAHAQASTRRPPQAARVRAAPPERASPDHDLAHAVDTEPLLTGFSVRREDSHAALARSCPRSDVGPALGLRATARARSL